MSGAWHNGMTRKSELIGDDNLARVLLDAVPIPVFLVDQSVQILDYNSGAADMLKGKQRAAYRQRYGNILQCFYSIRTGKPCGHASTCTACLVRQIVTDAFAGNKTVRQKVLLQTGLDEREPYIYLSASCIKLNGQPLVLLAIDDIGELPGLRRLIPVCASCRRIRGDDDVWHGFENYLTQNHHLDFTHGLCPECLKASLTEAGK